MDYKSYNELELSEINYSQPSRKLNYYMAKPDKEVIVLTNLLTCITDIITSENRCYINLELKKRLDSQLINFFVDLDERNICEVFKNSEVWFGKKIPLDVIEDFLTSFIRRKKNKQFIKININSNILENIEYLRNGAKILPILEYNGIIINKNQFKTEWELIDFIKEEDYDDGYDLSNVNDIDYNDNKNNLMSLIHNNINNTKEELDIVEEHVKEENVVEEEENVVEEEENVVEENVVEEEENVVEENETNVEEDENIVEEDENIVEEDENIVEDQNKTKIVEKKGSVQKLQQKANKKRRKRKIIKTHNRKIILS